MEYSRIRSLVGICWNIPAVSRRPSHSNSQRRPYELFRISGLLRSPRTAVRSMGWRCLTKAIAPSYRRRCGGCSWAPSALGPSCLRAARGGRRHIVDECAAVARERALTRKSGVSEQLG